MTKAKLDDEKKALADAKKTGWEPQAGLVAARAAISAYEENLKLRVGIKESTRQFYQWSLKAILKSWPELPSLDVRHISESQCQEWAKAFSGKYSATYYNNAVLVVNQVFEQAMKSGVIYRNPAQHVELKPKAQNSLVLPSREEFHKFVAVVRGGKHRTAQAAADLIEFLAYTGCRVSEARRVTWPDCNFEKEAITVKGEAQVKMPYWSSRRATRAEDYLVSRREPHCFDNPDEHIRIFGDRFAKNRSDGR